MNICRVSSFVACVKKKLSSSYREKEMSNAGNESETI